MQIISIVRNRGLSIAAAAVICAVLCAVFLPVLLPYTQPMDDRIFDFSMDTGETEAAVEWDGNGWEAFTDEGGVRTPLSPSIAGFSSLSRPGQTCYYSRVLDQDLPDPLLSITTANRSIAVFLDGELVHTDFPELDNRIGHLTLPMLDWDRQEPVRLSLPPDYVGKTLTIAQSTPPPGQSELQTDTLDVMPCGVQLYCGYAYESQIVAGASRAAYPAAVLALAALAVLALFFGQVLRGRLDWGLVCFAVLLFLNMVQVISSAPFGDLYFPFHREHGFFFLGDTASGLAAAMLPLFLATRMSPPRRYLLLSVVGLQLASVLLFALSQLRTDWALVAWYPGLMTTVRCLTLLSSAVVLILGAAEWRAGSRFFADFCKALLTAALAAAVIFAVKPAYCREVFTEYTTYQFPAGRFLQCLTLISSLWAVSAAFVAEKTRRSAETAALRVKEQMARESYADIQRQSRETAILRHDLKRHLNMVDALLADGLTGQARSYIQDVAAQADAVRPVLATGNYLVDTILNSRLSAAAEAGVHVRILRAEAPRQLPLKDADLCSLLLNALDNALQAAANPALEHPEIVIDLHLRGQLFCFSCENSTADPIPPAEAAQTETVPKHGYGLFIMERIAEKYGGILDTARTGDRFRLTLVLPAADYSEA